MRGKTNADEFIIAHLTWLDLAPAQFVEYSLNTPLTGCKTWVQENVTKTRGQAEPSPREPLSLQVCEVAYSDPFPCYIEYGL